MTPSRQKFCKGIVSWQQAISLLLILGCFFLSSCTYQFGHGELSERYSTISIPYIEGDQKGELTAEVVKMMSTSGAFRYVADHNGDLVLQIKLVELRDENIGFRYDRKRSGHIKKSLIPTETRVTALAEVTVVDARSGNILRGPTRITGNADFDHSYYTSRHAENVFSIGQLNDMDAARDAVMHPLNQHLAEKIVDYVINSW
jgi:hypothetical protein